MQTHLRLELRDAVFDAPRGANNLDKSQKSQMNGSFFPKLNAWKSGPVRSFVYIWQDRDWDRSLQVDGPQKTALNRRKPV
jgi:hypothetical protein